MSISILLIGKPHSGKTTFIAQLCAKVEANKSYLTLYKPIENLTPIIEATKSLAKGEEVKTTPTEKSTVISLPLQYIHEKLDFDCPDYGGEQINHIIENRELGLKWAESIKKSDNWILFIRPSSLSSFFDLSNKTITPDVLEGEGAGEKSDEHLISDQSSFIELLQILLETKGQDSHFQMSSVKLTVVLTCWDELKNTSTPKAELEKCLPLLFNFIKANWTEKKINILGLSALGFSLKETNNRKKYQEIGSENFGYLIQSDGTESKDITQLILESI